MDGDNFQLDLERIAKAGSLRGATAWLEVAEVGGIGGVEFLEVLHV